MEHWQEVEELFNLAIQISTENRRSFLKERCGTSRKLYMEILNLLELDEDSGSFLEEPVFNLGTKIIQDEFNDDFLRQPFAGYRLQKIISRGNPQVIFLAENIGSSQLEVLKILPSVLSLNLDTVHRFQQEAIIPKAVVHPNIIDIHKFNLFDHHYFIAMEYVAGRSLRELVSAEHLTAQRAIKICRSICSGLIALHRRGVIHCDIKPENIIVLPDDNVKIIDFGIARIYDTQLFPGTLQIPTAEKKDKLILGTPSYMSPDQHAGKELTPYADVWSLAAVFYELITQRRLFPRRTDFQTKLTDLAVEQITNSKLSPELQKFFENCFNPQPDQLFTCACAVDNALAELSHALPKIIV